MTNESRRRSKRGLLLCAFTGGALMGCAGQPRIASDLEPELPAGLYADYKSFTENCSKCHGLERALNAHVDDVHHWDLYVAKMMRTAGSAISAAEGPKILRFLYWYTERKERLASESKRSKRSVVEAPAPQPKTPAAAPSAPQIPAQSPAPAPAPQTDTAPVQEAVQHNQGESAP